MRRSIGFLFVFAGWLHIEACPPCFNGGTPSNGCRSCQCSEGWTGPNCLTKCGGVLLATGGYLRFPDSSQNYDNRQHCTWSFGFPTLSTILIKFISFDVEARYDFLIITDEQGTLAEFSGTSLPIYNKTISSTANITFTSDGSITGKGFVLEYQSLPGTFPIFVATPNDTHVLKNESLTLACNATGFPRPIVSWRKDGQPLARFDNGEYQIRSANEDVHPGVYTCIAENYLGITRHSFFLQVHVPPVIINGPVSAHFEKYTQYQQFFFRCDVYGIPKPEIYWKKNGKLILNPSYASNFVSWLRLELVPDSFANYSCYANNSAGFIESSPALLSAVNTSDDNLRFLHGVSANFPLVNSSVYFRFDVRYLYDYSGHFGLIRIEGLVRKVFKDGRPWDNSSYSSLTLPMYFDNYFRLTFAPVTLTDSGIYRFDVQIRPRYSFNKIGISRLSLHEHLEIRVSLSPKISPNIDVLRVDSNQHLVLLCSDLYSHPPSTLTWLSDGKEISLFNNSDAHVIHYYNRRSYLLVRSLKPFFRDRNWRINFTCQAKVDYFGESKAVSILVQPLSLGRHSNWSIWSTPSQCSSSCGLESGFRLSHRVCLLLPCNGPLSEIESCYPVVRNCSFPTDRIRFRSTTASSNLLTTNFSTTPTPSTYRTPTPSAHRTPTPSAYRTPTALEDSQKTAGRSGGLSAGGASGIAVAVTLVVVAIILLTFWFVAKRYRKGQEESGQSVASGNCQVTSNTYSSALRNENPSLERSYADPHAVFQSSGEEQKVELHTSPIYEIVSERTRGTLQNPK